MTDPTPNEGRNPDLERLNRFVGEWELEEVWKLWRDAPEFSQRFTGTFNDDGDVIEGTWERSDDGVEWEVDFDLTYTRVAPSAIDGDEP